MRRTLLALLISVLALTLHSGAAAPIAVMLLDGESAGAYHDWQHVTPVLKKILDETGLFAVTVVTAPAVTGALATFAPDFHKYRVVVMNHDAPDERWPASLKTSFEQYMTKGGGLVSVHAADNAFAGWRAFNEMIRYGDGRIFHTTLGHDISALSSVDFVVTLQRGTEWAATGAVTQKVPANFPTAETVSHRADLDAMEVKSSQ